jgi:hypothetical protein
MTPQSILEAYRRMMDIVGEHILVRRYTGTGVNRPRFDVDVRARVTDYRPEELVGAVVQGDRKVILLAEDLLAAQLSLPITATDKVVIRGHECAVIAPNDSTRRVQGKLIAYELTARG